jgi:hypothetical protein
MEPSQIIVAFGISFFCICAGIGLLVAVFRL